MALEVKPAKNSKLPKLPENCFQPVGKVGGHQYPPGSKTHALVVKILECTIFSK